MADTIEKMNSIRTKLEDIHNSQKALIEKTGVAQLEVMDTPDAKLEELLGKVLANASANSDLIGEALEHYDAEIDKVKAQAG